MKKQISKDSLWDLTKCVSDTNTFIFLSTHKNPLRVIVSVPRNVGICVLNGVLRK